MIINATMFPVTANLSTCALSSSPWFWLGLALVLVIAVVVLFLLRAGAAPDRAIRLVATSGSRTGETIDLDSTLTTIGTEKDNDIVLDDEKVSRHHARLEYRKGSLSLYDLNSLYGTFLNGTRVEQAACAHGDRVRLGPHAEFRIDISSG